MKASQLKISSNLWLLSLFGFAHGFHEWIALFLLIDGTQYSDDIIYTIKTLALIINGLSFLFLLLFGISLLHSITKNKYIKWLKPCVIILFAILIFYFFKVDSDYQHISFFKFANNVLRKTFGFIGSLATSLALIYY